jgi:hypothetical protein
MDKRIMTPEQLAAIRARAEAATKGVLTIDRYNHGGGRFSLDHAKGRQLVADFYEIGDREFYAEARADIPALLDHIERLQAKVDGLCYVIHDANGIAYPFAEMQDKMTAIINGAGNESEGA